MGDLVEYYGTECKFCVKMAPNVEKLEKETGLTVEKFEVWHNEENAKKWKKDDNGKCGGVPFFLNKKTGDFICGFADYPRLKEWASGKK